MLYPTERELMSDHDATQPPASGTPRPGEGDEFNARTVLINQELLDAARSESQPAAGQVPGSAPGAVPGAQAQAGSWRPAQPDLPAGPPPEEQTRAYPAGAGRAAAQPATAPADPYLQPNPYAQQGGTDPSGPPSPQSQPGQPAQFGQPDPAGGAGSGGATAPFQAGQPAAQPGGQPTPYSQPAQPAWGAPQADNGAAAAASPFAQSAPGVPSAPGAASDPAAAAASGATTGQETLSWQGPPQASARQPAPHSHPFSGGRHEGDVGMSSVFPTATARAEAEQMAETYAPQGAAQPVAQSAPSSAPSVPSQSSAPQWGSAPSSDAAAGQAPSFSDVVPGAAGAPFGQPAGGGAPAQVPDESADSVGSWMLTMFLAAIPLFGLIYTLILAFGSGHSASKRNWAIATLIWAAIATVLSILLYVVLGATLLAVVNSSSAG